MNLILERSGEALESDRAFPEHTRETARLARLEACAILDTPRDVGFDRLVFQGAQVFRVPIATIGFVDAHRQWFKAAVGVVSREIARGEAFGAVTVLQPEPLIVEDTLSDQRFVANPFVTGAPFIRFYAGAPLCTVDGLAIGSFCIMDRRPRDFSATEFRHLLALAREAEALIARRETSFN